MASIDFAVEHRPCKLVLNWLDLLLIIGTAIGILLLGLVALSLLNQALYSGKPIQSGPSLVLSLGVLTLEFIAIVGSVYLFAVQRRHLSWGDLGLRATSGGWLAAAVVLGVICIPLTSLISLAIMQALGLPLENPQAQALAPEGFSWTAAIGTTILGGLFVPFAEELFFRGVLYSFLRDRIGIWLATLISAIIFGFAHGDISVGGAAFVLGIMLAQVYQHSRSLWATFTIHAINNAAKIIVLYALLASGVKITGT